MGPPHSLQVRGRQSPDSATHHHSAAMNALAAMNPISDAFTSTGCSFQSLKFTCNHRPCSNCRICSGVILIPIRQPSGTQTSMVSRFGGFPSTCHDHPSRSQVPRGKVKRAMGEESAKTWMRNSLSASSPAGKRTLMAHLSATQCLCHSRACAEREQSRNAPHRIRVLVWEWFTLNPHWPHTCNQHTSLPCGRQQASDPQGQERNVSPVVNTSRVGGTQPAPVKDRN